MAKINIEAELLERHSDPEIIEYLYRLMAGVCKKYRIALEKGNTDVLWVSIGDIEQAASMLQALYKRDQARLAQSQE